MAEYMPRMLLQYMSPLGDRRDEECEMACGLVASWYYIRVGGVQRKRQYYTIGTRIRLAKTTNAKTVKMVCARILRRRKKPEVSRAAEQ